MSLAIHTDVKEPEVIPGEAAPLEEKVAVRRLNFYYGAFRALTDINVNLYKNKVTAFIGPSGCGKSTLLRILNRIYDLYPNQRAEGEARRRDGEDRDEQRGGVAGVHVSCGAARAGAGRPRARCRRTPRG